MCQMLVEFHIHLSFLPSLCLWALVFLTEIWLTSMCHKHTKATNSNSLNLTIPSWESATYTFFTVFQIEFFIKF